jgi:hypothetical protein
MGPFPDRSLIGSSPVLHRPEVRADRGREADKPADNVHDDSGRFREIQGDSGRFREIQGDSGCREAENPSSRGYARWPFGWCESDIWGRRGADARNLDGDIGLDRIWKRADA